MVDENTIPEKLFKYRYFDENNFYEQTLQNSLFFSSAKNFNDPFDSKVYPNYAGGSDKQIKRKIDTLLKDNDIYLSRKQRKKKLKLEFNRNIRILRSPKLMLTRVNDLINTSFGIYSLTEDNSNLLMWAHYAKNHTGFCIQYDAKNLFQICKNYLMIQELILLYKIVYAREYPIFNPFISEFDRSYLVHWLTIKSIDWSYEKEWRLIYADHPDTKLQFPDSIVSAVYFGAKCSATNRNKCMEILKTRKKLPLVFQAKLKDREFGIKFDKVEYS